METTTEITLEEIDQTFPPLIGRIVREVAEDCGLERFGFERNREYDPGSAPLFHYVGRGDVRVYMGGADSYLAFCDGTLDLYPIPTRDGKEQIAANECWIIESGRVEDTEDEHYLTVYQCFDVTQTP
jgi:hypothetical protein